MGPLLPRMGPRCARFIPKGLGLCDPHSSLTHSPPTRRQIPTSWALWLCGPGTEAGWPEAAGPLETLRAKGLLGMMETKLFLPQKGKLRPWEDWDVLKVTR